MPGLTSLESERDEAQRTDDNETARLGPVDKVFYPYPN